MQRIEFEAAGVVESAFHLLKGRSSSYDNRTLGIQKEQIWSARLAGLTCRSLVAAHHRSAGDGNNRAPDGLAEFIRDMLAAILMTTAVLDTSIEGQRRINYEQVHR